MPDDVVLFPVKVGEINGKPIRAVRLPGQSEPYFVMADLTAAVAGRSAEENRQTCLRLLQNPGYVRARLSDGEHVLGSRGMALATMEGLAADDICSPQALAQLVEIESCLTAMMIATDIRGPGAEAKTLARQLRGLEESGGRPPKPHPED